jgi:hypothetical protein
MLTYEEVEQALPKTMRGPVAKALTDSLNGIQEDPEVADTIRENFVGYATVLKDGRFKIEDYLHAVAYVSFKVMGYSNSESYQRVFPGRYQALVAKGTSSKDIAAYVTAYNRGKLVNLILEQTLVPTWVLNQDLYQKAINVQAELMTTSQSDKVRTDAANSLLTHLKKPEIKEFQLNVGVKEDAGMVEMREAMRKLAEQQHDLISKGVPTKLIAAQPIIEGEAIKNGIGETNSG